MYQEETSREAELAERAENHGAVHGQPPEELHSELRSVEAVDEF
jgi:hypothetical protein